MKDLNKLKIISAEQKQAKKWLTDQLVIIATKR